MELSNLSKLSARIVLILFVGVGLSACNSDDGKVRPSNGSRGNRTGGDGRNTVGTGSVGQQSSAGFTGVIWAGANVSQTDFQASVDGFMSVSADPVDLIGLVSGAPEADTGIRFLGSTKVEMNDGSIVKTNSSGSLKAGTGNLKILIWDEEAKDTGLAHQPTFAMNSGSITNGEIKLNFSDDHGKVTITGWISGQHFYGYVDYDNDRYWDGVGSTGRGEANRLGEFYIPVCDYFRCN